MREPRWRIELLGGLRARQGERVVERFRQKAGILLAYLACSPGRTHTREALADILWPELDPESARNSLRVALHVLRELLDPPSAALGAPSARSLLVVDRTTLALDPKLFVTDVREWQATLRAADAAIHGAERAALLAQAVDLYRGELLPGQHDAWILAERAHLAEEHLRSLQGLMRSLEELGELERALDTARRLVAADPLREESHCHLMRLYMGMGEPSATLRQYQELERILREELGDVPADATHTLAVELRNQARALLVARTAQPLAPIAVDRVPPPTETPDEAPGASMPVLGLPVQFTRFFGREEEIVGLQERLCLPGTRLLTLTGPGGAGKTRLAVAVAERLSSVGFPISPFEGVAFVPLADLREEARLGDLIADALGSPRTDATDAQERAIAALADRRWLLILDNFEHLTSDGALLVRQLLERVPNLTCLVTSRQRLNLSGEREWPVPLLPVSVSVPLFIDRAQAARPGFQVTDTNRDAIAELCERLEGLPLALELAAARSSVLSPAQLLERLGRRFELLVTRQRDVPERHRSLQAAISGSYDLLSPDLQRFFAALSIFRGGWMFEAAEAVCQAPRALEALEELRDCSLIVTEVAEDTVRYRMLESLRQFAWERLEAMGEHRAEVRTRHRDWHLQLAERAQAENEGPAHGAWLERLEREHDNLRAALEWCREESAGAEAALRIGTALDWFWTRRGHITEGRRWLEEALARGGSAPAAVRAGALASASLMATFQKDPASGMLAREARRLYEELLPPVRAAGDASRLARRLSLLAGLSGGHGDSEAAWAYFEESAVLFRQSGEWERLSYVLRQLARLCGARGDHVRRRALLEEALALGRAEGKPTILIHALGALGHVASEEGDYERARALHTESLILRRELGDWSAVAQSLEALACLDARQGLVLRAARLLGATDTYIRSLGRRPPVTVPEEYHRALATCREALGEETFAALWAEGSALSLAETLAMVTGEG